MYTEGEDRKFNLKIIPICIIAIGALLYGFGFVYEHFIDKHEDTETSSGDISETEKKFMVATSNLVFSKFDDYLSLNNIYTDGEKFVNFVEKLENKKITEVECNKIRADADYFLDYDNYECKDIYWEGEEIPLYLFNKDINKYVLNPMHPGHTYNLTKFEFYLGGKDFIKKGNNYQFTAYVFYYSKGCNDADCTTLNSFNIYITSQDLINNKNNVDINGLCKNNDSILSCNNSEIVEKLKDNLNVVTFNYKKINNKLIFVNYEIN